MTFAMACTLHKELEQLNSHSDLQALVIRSEGRHFCDGGDPSSWVSDALAETKTSDGKGSKFDLGVAAAAVHEVVSLCTVLSNFSVPVLAILQGSVRGVGLALALAVDWRVCTSDARFKCENSDLFGLDEAMRGIVGPRHGLQTANLLSSTIQADKAVEVGLVSSMHDTLDEATSATVSLANAIASASKAATSNSMQLLRFHRDTNSIMTSCVNFAASLSPPNTNVLIDSGEDIRLRVSLGQSSKILHLFAETTPSEVLGLLESSATQPAASSAPTEALTREDAKGKKE